MILKTGDMFRSPPPGVGLIATGNSYIRKDGRLTMGRGAAEQLKLAYPNADRMFGDYLKEKKLHLGFYGFVSTTTTDDRVIGLFQSKIDFKDPSTLQLITDSTKVFAEHANSNQRQLYRLNFPGVNFGGLQALRAEILDIISELPDNVEIWEF